MELPHDDQTIIIVDEQAWRPRAAVVARIGTELASAGKFADPLNLTPIYIRRPEAEEKFEARRDALRW
jgi:hypothetical protein